jgi:DNA invertase Pin-like site-specific DNA recombinase
MRIATYTRISTDEDRQPFSLGAQAERLEAYARSQDGWRIVRRFTDQASGATLDRPGLRQALSEAAAGVYELLLVYRVDRLPEAFASSRRSARTSTTLASRFAPQPSRSIPPPPPAR